MNEDIHLDLTCDAVMRRWPATIRTFLDFGMSCVGCPIAGFHTLMDACEEHGIEPERLLDALDGVRSRELLLASPRVRGCEAEPSG